MGWSGGMVYFVQSDAGTWFNLFSNIFIWSQLLYDSYTTCITLWAVQWQTTTESWGRDKMAAILQTTFSNPIFLNGNVWISNKFSLNVVPTVTVNNIPSLFKIMAWRLVGAKPLSETMLVRLPTDICVTRPEWVNLLLVVLNGWVMSAGDCPITVTSWWARWRPKSLASPLFAQLLV